MKRNIENQMSDEMLLIVCEPPGWLMRTGSGILTGIILLFLASTWVLKYPEVLKGSVVIATQTPAIRVVSPATGRMAKLLIHDGAMVKKGDVLAETENTMKLENIPAMHRVKEQTRAFLENPSRVIEFPSDQYVWGDLQDEFNRLRQNYLDYKRLQSDGYRQTQIQQLQQQADDLRAIVALQDRQKQLIEQTTLNATETFNTDEKLFQEGVSSRMDYVKSKNKLLEKQEEQIAFGNAVVTTSLKIKELNTQIYDIDHAFVEKQRTCLDNIQQSLHNIENSLNDWRQNYLISAPADGKLVFLKELTENQHLRAMDTLFAVMPAEENYIATMEIPVRGMGKAKVGQKVIIKLDDYPYQEFGMLEGEVQSVFPSLNIRYYRVAVGLPKGLQSTSNKQFFCRAEMAGTAEIVTADLRMIERAFYGILKLLS